MKRYFVNGLNSKTGGGKSILNNYLTLLHQSNSKDRFFVLTPAKNDYEKYSSDFIQIIDFKEWHMNRLATPYVNKYVLPRLLREIGIDAIFNMSDIVIPTDIPQLYLFDWSYAAYPDSIIWKKMDLKSYANRKMKLMFFKKYIKNASTVIAQTETMKKKLHLLYGLNNIEVVPNAISLDNLSGGEIFDFQLPKEKIKLLYLTYYYSHKNIEIFIPLAKRISEMKLPYCIIVTLESKQHRRARQFLNAIEDENLKDVIINVGPVPMVNVPSLYTQTDALLMPTLLESFSGTYVEAMFHNRTIMTSNLDFAIDVCEDAAFYFEPLNVDSILSSINTSFGDNELRKKKIENGQIKLNQMLDWNQAFKRYQYLLESIAI